MGTAPNGYTTPKTNWVAGDIPTAESFNRIEGNIQAVEEGSRTIDPAQAPTGNTGTLRQLLDWFANRIKAITGKTNWYDNPDITLSALAAHKGRHAIGGDDPLTPADIGAVANTGDNTITGGKLTVSRGLGGVNQTFFRAQATDGKTYDFIIRTDGSFVIYNATDSKTVFVFGPTSVIAPAGMQVIGNGGALDLIGTDRFYMEFYPRGTTAGRKAYIGFPDAGSTVLTFCQEDAGNMNFAVPTGYDLVVNGAYRIRHEGNYAAFSGVWAFRNSALSLAASTWTKVIFDVKNPDYLAEYDTATGRFTAKKAGVYFISFRVTFDAPPAGNQYQAAMYKNGTRVYVGNTGVTPGGYSVASVGSVVWPLAAGDYIEIYAFTGPSGPVNVKYGASTETGLWIARIA